MKENKFWIRLWETVIIGIVSVVIVICVSVQQTNQKVVEMVKAGADPLEAACALQRESTYVCLGVVHRE